MLAQVLREVYANNQFLLFRRLTPAQYFPLRHAGTPRITSYLRRNFRRNVHGFQSGKRLKLVKSRKKDHIGKSFDAYHIDFEGMKSAVSSWNDSTKVIWQSFGGKFIRKNQTT